MKERFVAGMKGRNFFLANIFSRLSNKTFFDEMERGKCQLKHLLAGIASSLNLVIFPSQSSLPSLRKLNLIAATICRIEIQHDNLMV